MPDTEAGQAAILEACAVVVRLRGDSAEFCLMAIPGDGRWEFPHAPLRDAEDPAVAAVRVAAELAGLNCRLFDPVPLGEFHFMSDGARRFVTAYLLSVAEGGGNAAGPIAASRGPRWFLPEEARARLRRKPMRLIATVAQRRLIG